MARQKRRKRKSTRRKKSEPLAGWVWMLFGLAVGLAVAAAIYINDRRPPQAAVTRDAAQPAPAAPKKKAAESEAEPRFDFYEMLPTFELVIPEQDLEARPDVTPAAVETPGAYVLQAGTIAIQQRERTAHVDDTNRHIEAIQNENIRIEHTLRHGLLRSSGLLR